MLQPIDYADLDPELREVLRPRYERLGYLGDFFRYMAHQPRALAAFTTFTEECKRALDPALAETVALTVASRLDNAYERNQHERLAIRTGLGREWVIAVERLTPDAAGDVLDERQRAAQRFVLAAIEHDNGDAPRHFDTLVAATDEATATAVALLTARFVGHAVISRACRLAPPVASIFEDGFDGD